MARSRVTWIASWPGKPAYPMLVAEDPLTCAVRGAAMAPKRIDKLGSFFLVRVMTTPQCAEHVLLDREVLSNRSNART